MSDVIDPDHFDVAVQAAMGSPWQPIETAPKDRRVLLFFPAGGECWKTSIGSWEPDRWAKKPRPYWTNDCERIIGVLTLRKTQPSHWMPLPAPPGDAP